MLCLSPNSLSKSTFKDQLTQPTILRAVLVLWLTFIIIISIQPPRSTRSSSVVTLSHPPTISTLTITNRSFRHVSLESTPLFIPSDSPVMFKLTSSFTCQLISVIITILIIHHSRLKPTFPTNPAHLSTSSTLDCLHNHGTGPDLLCFSIYF